MQHRLGNSFHALILLSPHILFLLFQIALKLVRKDGKIEPQNAGVDEVKAEHVHISDEIKFKEETQAGAKSVEGSHDDKPSEYVAEALEAPVNQMQKSTDEDTHLQVNGKC